MHGAETELDRQILQAIQDPLTHMIRNSVDHVIELPETRRAAGKPERGTIRLNAYHEGHVILEITDDGAGISAARVRAKAVERGLVKAAVAAAMPDSQILRYIFEPDFSTAEKITNVSGRGVGMDVVRSNIEKIGGTVDLISHDGTGTTVRVKIPLTLAIISALLVGSAGQAFAHVLHATRMLGVAPLGFVGKMLRARFNVRVDESPEAVRGRVVDAVAKAWEPGEVEEPGEEEESMRETHIHNPHVVADGDRFKVVDDDGKVYGTHDSRAEADAQVDASFGRP